MKSILFALFTLISLSCCTRGSNYSKDTIKIPVVYKYKTIRQFSIFPPEPVWIAKLSNGDSIKTNSMPPDTVTFIYYKKIK